MIQRLAFFEGVEKRDEFMSAGQTSDRQGYRLPYGLNVRTEGQKICGSEYRKKEEQKDRRVCG